MGGAGWVVMGGPIGLVTSGGMKAYGETSDSATIDGRAKATARQIASVLKARAPGSRLEQPGAVLDEKRAEPELKTELD